MKKTNYPLIKHVIRPLPLVLVLLFLSLFLRAQPPGDDASKDTGVVKVEPVFETDLDEDEEGKEFFFLPRSAVDTVLSRSAGDSAIASMLDDDDFWYANAVFKKRKEEERQGTRSRSFFDSRTFEILLWFCIIGGFIAVLIIYLHNNNASLFRSSKAIKVTDDDLDPDTDDIFSINYSRELDRAVAAGNYRLGVRLLFLQLLRGLSEKNIIQYKQDRTNLDYLMQVSQASWYPLFFRLTRNYEYAWYGHFDIDSEKFDIIRKDFADLQKKLPAT